MGKNNKNSNESAYSSELEKYLDGQDNDSSDDLNFDEESSFQTSNIGGSRLDEYVGIDDDEEEYGEIKYCSICGKELKKFNYGDKCDDCVKKCELVTEINELLDYISPSEELKRDVLLDAGFDELKLNITVSNLLDENLIVLGSKGIFLTDVKTLNRFFRVYGSSTDILDESIYKNLMFSEDFVDISQYSDLVQIMFNPRNNKWEVNLFRDGRAVVKKFFAGLIDANNYATRYLKEMGELNNLHDKKPVEQQQVKYKRSKHKFVIFSPKRNQWFVKVKGHVGSKIVGFYDTEEEAVIARDEYIRKKRENQAKLRRKFVKKESDAIISFNERANQWVVKVKKKRGFKKLGYYDTEEEAIAAKNEYYGIGIEMELDNVPMFNEGDKVQVTSGPFEFNFGIVTGFNEERDSFIVKLENPDVSLPIFIKSDNLRLI
ncbi:hypothetical protein [Methanobrevibacter sp.]|uniref:hypothetical protein n=1 Tax=Methanobrevibacter sp. TaxID=66852 RepID=UPI003867B4E6